MIGMLGLDPPVQAHSSSYGSQNVPRRRNQDLLRGIVCGPFRTNGSWSAVSRHGGASKAGDSDLGSVTTSTGRFSVSTGYRNDLASRLFHSIRVAYSTWRFGTRQ